MKALILTTVGMFLTTTQLQATIELSCLPARTIVGYSNSASTNPVVKTYVWHSEAGWLIYHTLADNTIVDRADQYNVYGTSNYSVRDQWTGVLDSNQDLMMIGEIRNDPRTGRDFYVEVIYDKAKNGALIVKTVAACDPIGNTVSPKAAEAPNLLPNWDSPQSGSSAAKGNPATLG